MIPSEDQAKKLWKKYHLPESKRVHMTLVAAVAVFLGEKIKNVNIPLLQASALLHDIDKAVGGKHPDMAVKILQEEGMGEVSEVVSTHSLHCILDPILAPKTWEQKLLYLADKMVKYDIVGVDRRFLMWREELLPQKAMTVLDRSYTKVKQLEKEVFDIAGISFQDVVLSVEGGQT